jgi:GDP-D-mannose dehydratase
LDWRDHTEVLSELRRPSDISESRVNPIKAHNELDWQAKQLMPDVVRMMVAEEFASPNNLKRHTAAYSAV